MGLTLHQTVPCRKSVRWQILCSTIPSLVYSCGAAGYTWQDGQFEVLADGETVANRGGNWLTRSFGAGCPDFCDVTAQLEKHIR